MGTVTFNQPAHNQILALATTERWRRGLLALLEVGKDPNRTDKVLEAYEHMNAGSENQRARRFYRSAAAVRFFEENRTLDATTVDYDRLLALPEGTLGYSYARFMKDRGLTPDIFTCEGALSPAAYFSKRMRQTHDLWHVITGVDTDVAGELELQAFTLAQVWAPSQWVLVGLGTLRALFTAPSMALGAVRGFFRGLRARKFAPVAWEERWAEPLADVRRSLSCGA